jgi:hypothetical protein
LCGPDGFYASVVAKGKQRWGDDFHMSSTFIRDHRPWWVKDPSRDVCLCRYHLEFDLFATGLGKLRKQLKCYCDRLRDLCVNWLKTDNRGEIPGFVSGSSRAAWLQDPHMYPTLLELHEKNHDAVLRACAAPFPRSNPCPLPLLSDSPISSVPFPAGRRPRDAACVQ